MAKKKGKTKSQRKREAERILRQQTQVQNDKSKEVGKNENKAEPFLLSQTSFLKKELPRTVVFVDYENWYFSMLQCFGIKPNIKHFVENISASSDIVSMAFYADFSNKVIDKEFQNIKAFTNLVIDTKHPSGYSKKDQSDFILLDDLYQQCVTHNNIERVVLLSGDGHFCSAMGFLKKLGFETVIYAVTGTLDRTLQRIADSVIMLPDSLDYLLMYAKEILLYMRQKSMESPFFKFHFLGIIDDVRRRRKCYSIEHLKSALSLLINEGYLETRVDTLGKTDNKNVLVPHWDRIFAANLIMQSTHDERPSLAAAQQAYEKNGRNGDAASYSRSGTLLGRKQ